MAREKKHMKTFNYLIHTWVDLWVLGFIAFMLLAAKGYVELASWVALVTVLVCIISMVKLQRNRS